MNDSGLRNRTMSSILWRFAERCGAQGVSFAVSVVLARLLAPDVYGTIALVSVFITILQVFVDSGMANSLIQKKDADDIDFSTVFYFNIIVCFILYCVMFIAAPVISAFYEDKELIPIIRVLSLTLLISGIKNVQQAYISRNLLFKRFFFATLGGTIGAAIIGITLAYLGYGVWALVAQQLFNATVDTIILWISVKWRPKRVFSLERLKALFSYGWKLLASGLLDTVYNNIRQLVIGKMYSPSDLAFYNKGQQMPSLIITNINASIDSVLLPVMSREQRDNIRVKDMTRRAIKTSTYIIAPMMVGLTAVAPTIINILFTEKWLSSVPFLRIFCIIYLFYPIQTANLNAIKALGRSDLFLKLEIIKKSLGFGLLVSTMWYGVMAMAYSLLINCFLGQIINSWPNRKLLKYSYLEQLKDILPGIVLAVIMGVCVSAISLMPIQVPEILLLVIQIVVGFAIYVIGSEISKNDSYMYLKNTIKSYF
jgi:O-antigen/teichoic acid export membrane protein